MTWTVGYSPSNGYARKRQDTLNSAVNTRLRQPVCVKLTASISHEGISPGLAGLFLLTTH